MNCGNDLDYNSGYRYKDRDCLMLENTSLITKLPTASSWLLTKKNQMDAVKFLGYSKYDMKLTGVGGTIFSDAIMNIKYIFTEDEKNFDYYIYKTETSDKIKLYEYKNNLPIGLVYNKDANLDNIPQNLDLYDYQNYIYKNLFNKNDEIIEKLENINFERSVRYEEKAVISLKSKINIDGDKILYFYYEKPESYIYININNERVKIPNVKERNSVTYPNYSNNRIIELGTFSNEEILIEIHSKGDLKEDSIKLGLLDLKKYNSIFNDVVNTEFKNENNKICVKVNVEDGNKKMFLPFAYDDNFKLKNNGKDANLEKVLCGMMSVNLENGENVIEIEYKNDLFKIGAIITIISILLIIVFYIIGDKIFSIKIIKNIIYWIYLLITMVFYLFVYVLGISLTFFL